MAASQAAATASIWAGLPPRRQLLLMGGALTLLYVLGSLISPGFYQHDEAGHYSSMRGFWADPSSVLGAWAKPGYKLLYALPALGGPWAVLVFNAAVAALTVLATAWAAARLGLRQPLVAAALVALQPLWAGLAWRNYAELPSALMLVLAVALHAAGRRLAAALVFSYLVTLRQELLPLAGVYGLWLLWQRQWAAALALGLGPLLINLWGWAAKGDPIYLLNELLNAQSAYRDAWVRQGGEHYFVMALPTFGALAMVGLIAYGVLVLRRQVAPLWPVLLPVLVYGGLHVLFNVQSLGFGPSTGGNLRYMTVLSPMVALLAAAALEAVPTLEARARQVLMVVLGLFVAVTAVALSYEHNLVRLTDQWALGPLLTVLLAVAVVLFARGERALIGAALGLGLLGLVLTGKRVKLTAEELEVKKAATWAKRERAEGQPLIATHTLFFYFYGKPAPTVPGWSSRLNDSTLAAAPVGTRILWDSHYSYRPQLKLAGQVDYAWFQQRRGEYAEVRQFIAPDQSFGLIVFEKRGAPAAPAPAPASAP